MPPAHAPQRPARYVAYYRVSTEQQGRSGLGLEAQQAAVERHVAALGGELAGSFQEVESGRRKDRPELTAALAACRAMRATLIIAKLDRLARNVAFVSNLMESGVEFVAVDMPQANRLTVHIIAAMAEHEREMISQRTRAALAAAKARGARLGNPRLQAGSADLARAAAAAKSAKARERARTVLPYIRQAQRAGATTLAAIAEALTARGIATPSGRGRWHPATVRRVMRAE